jgi:hypothetical protein
MLERLADLHQRGPKRTLTQHLDLPLSVDLRWNGYEPSNGDDRQNAEALFISCASRPCAQYSRAEPPRTARPRRAPAHGTVGAIERAGFAEHFDPLTGEGGGGGSFSGTAAAYLVLAEVDSRRDTSSG